MRYLISVVALHIQWEIIPSILSPHVEAIYIFLYYIINLSIHQTNLLWIDQPSYIYSHTSQLLNLPFLKLRGPSKRYYNSPTELQRTWCWQEEKANNITALVLQGHRLSNDENSHWLLRGWWSCWSLFLASLLSCLV